MFKTLPGHWWVQRAWLNTVCPRGVMIIIIITQIKLGKDCCTMKGLKGQVKAVMDICDTWSWLVSPWWFLSLTGFLNETEEAPASSPITWQVRVLCFCSQVTENQGNVWKGKSKKRWNLLANSLSTRFCPALESIRAWIEWVTRLNRVKLVKTDSVSNLSSSHPPVSLNLQTGRHFFGQIGQFARKWPEEPQ